MKFSTVANSFGFSGVREMFDKALAYHHVVNLCLGEPGEATPAHIIKVGAEELEKGNTKYTPNAGILPLREAICKKLKRENNLSADPYKNIIVTAGATEALLLALMILVNPGDEVLIPNPCWPNYIGQVKMVGGIPVGVLTTEETGFVMTAEMIEKQITSKTKVLMLNSPSNPTGGMIDKETLQKIAHLAMQYNLVVISDEPYEKIVFDNNEHTSIGSFKGMEERTITINSFSKAYAMTGFRVGYACAEESIIKEMIKLHENVSSCINGAFQLACAEALEGAQQEMGQMVRDYKRKRDFIVKEMNQIKGFSCISPKGAFYAFVNIKELGMTAKEASDLILENTQVVTSPGSAFGSGGEGYIRLSFGVSMEQLEEAVRRLKQYFGSK